VTTPDRSTRYLETQVLTASPGQLLVIAYDIALRALRQAADHMTARNYEGQQTEIAKAQMVLDELLTSLDAQANPQLASHLSRLYTYLYQRLSHANVRDDRGALDEVINVLGDLRAAWAEADVKARQEAAAGSGAR
jgi:flagellar protein FliS